MKLTNSTKIEQALNMAQRTARVRTMTYQQLLEYVAQAERVLSDILYKKDWEGLVLEIDSHNGRFPSAYRGYPESTFVRLERKNNAWHVLDIRRVWCTGKRHAIIGLADKAHKMAHFVTKNFNDI